MSAHATRTGSPKGRSPIALITASIASASRAVPRARRRSAIASSTLGPSGSPARRRSAIDSSFDFPSGAARAA
ncbi:MAG TPA: hypothetical protein VE093_49135 [Polyangiaceae bacterium]|nr:hypothetical protein [Polyangiaceae bacterium]